MTWCTGLALAGAVAGCGQPTAVRTVGSQGGAVGSWGRAIEVPGLAALNKGGEAEVNSVSCASAGNCTAGGYYDERRGYDQQGFVAVERHGRWGTAIEVPGLGALNTGGEAEVTSVSCASAGNCAAGGDYGGPGGRTQGFVVSEENGLWGQAIEVPGLGALNKGHLAAIHSVSCASAGNCTAGGHYYADRAQRGFVASEKNGEWGQAIEVPGLGALNTGGDADVYSVSCASAGNCAAGGRYLTRRYDRKGFVAVERNGVWGQAIDVPGLDALNKGGYSRVFSVSCASAGNCTAGGHYEVRSGGGPGFVAVERDGRWGRAGAVPGMRALNKGGYARVNSVSCGSAGNCAAGGAYQHYFGHGQGFVAVERDGRWGRAIEVPGLGALNTGGYAEVNSVSCGSAGTCVAGGFYYRHGFQGFVAVERDGHWGTAIEVPGLGALDAGRYAQVNSVSCAPAGTCAAGGSYSDRHHHSQGFVVSHTG